MGAAVTPRAPQTRRVRKEGVKMNPIVIMPSTLLLLLLGAIIVALILGTMLRPSPPTPTVVVSPDPEYGRRSPGVGAFLVLVLAIGMVFAIAAVFGP